jgi:hypothetical protein
MGLRYSLPGFALGQHHPHGISSCAILRFCSGPFWPRTTASLGTQNGHRTEAWDSKLTFRLFR